MFNFLISEKYKIHLIRHDKEIKTIDVKISKSIVKVEKDKSYPIKDTDVSYRKKNIYHIFINYDTGAIMKLDRNEKDKFNTKLIDLIMSTKVIGDLASRMNPTTTLGSLGLTLIFIVLGISIGFIIGNIFDIQGIQNAIRNIKMPSWG